MIYLKLLLTFIKIGAFTFGGGYAMLPLIQEEVLSNNWISEEELINFIAVSESTPGPFAVNISTYIGMRTGGFPGALCATLGVVLPSFIIILIVARFFAKFKKSNTVTGIMSGLKPAVIGLIAAAILSLAKTIFLPGGIAAFSPSDISLWISLALFLIMTVLALKKVHPIIIIVASAALGIVAGFALG